MIACNVAQLLKSPVGTTRHFQFREEPPLYAPDVSLASALEGSAHLTRTSRGILVESTFTTSVKQRCSRCLEPCETAVEGHISEEFLPTTDIVTGELVLPEDGEENYLIDRDHILDLTEAVRQEILLQIPLQPLHSPECLGLCPQCGQNLNRGRCGCQGPGQRSPFEVLARWFDKMDEETTTGTDR